MTTLPERALGQGEGPYYLWAGANRFTGLSVTLKKQDRKAGGKEVLFPNVNLDIITTYGICIVPQVSDYISSTLPNTTLLFSENAGLLSQATMETISSF